MRTRSMRNHDQNPRKIRQQNRQRRDPIQKQPDQPVQPHIDVVDQTQDALHRLYTNVKSIPSYSSKIIDFLRQNEASSLHKRVRKKFKRRKTVAYYPYDICMADLAFYNSRDYIHANNGYKYILVFIDVFSKMCYVEPMKDKNGHTTLTAIENILRKLPEIPHQIITDEGTEFYNSYVQKLFDENGIVHYSLRGPHKASVAERMIQTMKGRLEKYFWENKTKKYVDILQNVIDNYNRTPHRSIGMAPIKVNRSNRDQVFKKLYPNQEIAIKPRLEVGDKVRIAKSTTIFEKGYTRKWSIDIYTIVSAKSKGGVDYYKVEDESGNILPRQRYYYELNLVKKNDT